MHNKNTITLEKTADVHEGLIEVTDGVHVLHEINTEKLFDSIPKKLNEYSGEPDIVKINKDMFDAFVKANINSELFGGKVLKEVWMNTYNTGDEMPVHRDWTNPKSAVTVIANVAGSAQTSFPESQIVLETKEGDVVLLDGMVNPEHSVVSTSPRISVVGFYQ